MEEVKLKPCPFCGGEVKKFIAPLMQTVMFVCQKCGADVCFYGSEHEPKATEAWNRRMMKHGIEELDRGQLDLMWNFLRFDCGQKSDIPTLKEHLDMLRQLMTQKTGGQAQYKKADDVSFEDLGTIINCIVIETMQLYLSGDLDRLEQSPCETCPYYPHDEDRKTMIGCNE